MCLRARFVRRAIRICVGEKVTPLLCGHLCTVFILSGCSGTEHGRGTGDDASPDTHTRRQPAARAVHRVPCTHGNGGDVTTSERDDGGNEGGDDGSASGAGVTAVTRVSLLGLVARRPATLGTCGLEVGRAMSGGCGGAASTSEHSSRPSTLDTDSSLEDMRNPGVVATVR